MGASVRMIRRHYQPQQRNSVVLVTITTFHARCSGAGGARDRSYERVKGGVRSEDTLAPAIAPSPAASLGDSTTAPSSTIAPAAASTPSPTPAASPASANTAPASTPRLPPPRRSSRQRRQSPTRNPWTISSRSSGSTGPRLHVAKLLPGQSDLKARLQPQGSSYVHSPKCNFSTPTPPPPHLRDAKLLPGQSDRSINY
jgi:hypothetical protein